MKIFFNNKVSKNTVFYFLIFQKQRRNKNQKNIFRNEYIIFKIIKIFKTFFLKE
jgi:hypothetical protein